MPLDFQLVQAPLRFGLAEGVDPHQVPFGTLVTAENACWTKSGRLEKRLGTSAPLTQSIAGGGSIASAKRLIARGSELALTDGSHLYSYAGGFWVDRGRHPELGLTWTTLQDSISGARASDIAYLSDGRIVQIWSTGDPADSGNTAVIKFQIVDGATGAVLTDPTTLDSASGYHVRVVASGTTFTMLWVKDANLKSYTGSGSPTTFQPLTLRTDVIDTTPNKVLRKCFDACVIGSTFVVAYVISTGGIKLCAFTFNTTPTAGATGAVAATSATTMQSITVDGASGETLYVGFIDYANLLIRVAGHNPSTLASVFSPVTLKAPLDVTNGVISLCRRDSTSCLATYSYDDFTAGGGSGAGLFFSASVSNGGAITVGRDMTFMQLMSRPFALGGRFYQFLTLAWNNEDFAVTIAEGAVVGADTFLVDVTVVSGENDPPRLVGKLECLTGSTWGVGCVATPAVVSSTQVLLPSPFVSKAVISGTNYPTRQGVRLVSVTTGASVPADMWRSVQIGQEAYLSAGVLTSYDGLEALGYGWAHASYLNPNLTATSTVGGSIAAGTYLYSVHPERRSAAGILHRGPTGPAIARTTTGATSKVTIYIAPCSLEYSAKNPGEHVLFRSVVGGTILQRLTKEPTTNVFLDIPDPPFSLVDTSDDATLGLSSQPTIYTTGEELDDFQLPAATTVALHRNRLFVVLGDGQTVGVSKDYSSNPGVAPGFHPTQTLFFPESITALASLDDKLIAFSRSRPYYTLGDGPAPNGNGSDYQTSPIQSDVGCTNPRSVVTTPDGILFQSDRGIYLLTRALEVAWIGRPVQDELAAYPNITSAVLVASRSEIRFTANNAGGSAGIVLVYNYVEKQWTTSKYTVGGVYGAPIADALLWNGVWTFVTPAGLVVSESTTTNLDGSTWVPLTLETAWVNAGGPLAFQSVRHFEVEGISNTDHNLTLSVGFNTDPSYPQVKSFAAGTPVTSPGPFESCAITIGTRRKCQAIRFKIQDATPSSGTVGTGKGPSFDMLGIEVGGKRGFRPKPATQMG